MSSGVVRCQVERFLEMRAMNAPQQKQQQQFPGGMNHGGFPPVGGGMRTMGYPSLGPDTALGNLSQGVSLGALHGVGGGGMGSMGGMGAIGAPGIGALHGRQVP